MRKRLRLQVSGLVQGVGFRPFIYRLALDCGLSGFVTNSPAGVQIEIEGPSLALNQFRDDLEARAPHHAVISGVLSFDQPLTHETGFYIKASNLEGARTALVLPDLATCPDCLKDIRDPENRRHHYAFTNCTYCGPRYSIIDSLPYDRARTTMAKFPMCKACFEEFTNPLDRRFHAQPIACPNCGPKPWLCNAEGRIEAEDFVAIEATASRILAGEIVAIKGLAGFQLLCLADSEPAIMTLRQRKHRPSKPLAILCRNLASARRLAEINDFEARLLECSATPIVLLRHRSLLPDLLAPRNAWLGIMLPATPLHHLLLELIDRPVVATSANLSDEPLCYRNSEALARLGRIADAFLLHDRPVLNPCDDSVAMIIQGKTVLVRRARGYAPKPIPYPQLQDRFAFGGDLKNSFAHARQGQVFLSPHHGDLKNAETQQLFSRNRSRYLEWFPGDGSESTLCDLHPDYYSTLMAEAGAVPIPVQHHVAHLYACAGEHRIKHPFLGIIWDGTGYGPDHSIWGGEFLLATDTRVTRVGHLLNFPLPGGEKAVAEPERVALGLLYQVYGNQPQIIAPMLPGLTGDRLDLMLQMCSQGFNSPLTSSVGRLFDGVAALCGFLGPQSHEGMAACWLESIADESEKGNWTYHLTDQQGHWMLDWRPMIAAIAGAVQSHMPRGQIAARFQNALVQAAIELAGRIGCPQVVLGGGCFQNRTLYRQLFQALVSQGFRTYAPQQVPPGDGGIAFGQILAAGIPLIYQPAEVAEWVTSQKERQLVSGTTR